MPRSAFLRSAATVSSGPLMSMFTSGALNLVKSRLQRKDIRRRWYNLGEDNSGSVIAFSTAIALIYIPIHCWHMTKPLHNKTGARGYLIYNSLSYFIIKISVSMWDPFNRIHRYQLLLHLFKQSRYLWKYSQTYPWTNGHLFVWRNNDAVKKKSFL